VRGEPWETAPDILGRTFGSRLTILNGLSILRLRMAKYAALKDLVAGS
jgi:hypothetical protein